MLSPLCLGTRPRYILVVDKDVKKLTNQPTNQTNNVSMEERVSQDSMRFNVNRRLIAGVNRTLRVLSIIDTTLLILSVLNYAKHKSANKRK